MRYFFAGLLVVAGLIVGGIGILQKTVWAPDAEIISSADFDEPGSVIVVEPGVLNLYETPAKLTVEGEGEITIAQASKENVDAWVGTSTHTVITGIDGEGGLTADKVDGEEDTTPPVAGADLWNAETTAESPAQLEWDDEAGRTSFIIGTDGEAPAASKVSLAWPNDTTTSWAIPFMIIGVILIGLGILSGWYSRKRAMREAQRRQARQERRKKLAQTGAAFAVVPVIALAGCGQEEVPKAQPSDPPETAPAVVDDAQAERILGQIAETVAGADEGLDAEALKGRADGPFLAQREAAYKVKDKAEDAKLPPAVAADEIALNFTSATDQWPRVTELVTKSSEDGSLQLLVLSQADPRENYKLWAQTSILGGAEIPEVADARQGAELLGSDAEGLRLTPADTLKKYADVLGKGEDSEDAKTFTEDALRKHIAEAQKKQKDSLSEGKAKAEFAYDTEGAEVVAQRTADGGALVTGSIRGTTTISPDKQEDRVGRLTLPKTQSKITGEKTTQKKLETEFQYMVTFVVPPGEDGEITLVGFTEALTGAKLI
ncbi:hypothetical protein [Brevibacterium otitidis]|uniref:DUF8094 domain-containing protein n=1 Tax=Brevibacterium otitidis TaxID=53364 RepID=A0ABV5X1Q6_9MICO|nr:hypothetical protein GCM10023233_22250 [Brevibacterium otitidis]